MLKGLERTLHWRDVSESPPPAVGFVLVAQISLPLRTDEAACRAAYWDGREFLDTATLQPIHAVTHWMPYPELPKVEEMRRVFRQLLGDMETP